jgi:hypothetical protein
MNISAIKKGLSEKNTSIIRYISLGKITTWYFTLLQPKSIPPFFKGVDLVHIPINFAHLSLLFTDHSRKSIFQNE